MSGKLSKWAHKIIKNLLYVPPIEGAVCSTIIKNELAADKPSMIARFGSVEIKGILYNKVPTIFKPLIKNKIFGEMHNNAGFFPVTDVNMKRFSKLMMEDMQLLDILGSWRVEESFLQKNFSSAKRILLRELEPYNHTNPWSEILENKKVLVIHPFNTTIESQYYTNREKLFSDSRVLPKFTSLETLKAVQTIAGNKSAFKDWFDALDYMKSEINKKDFDIAIIGCGAYGFPLAAHIKRMGKKAVHLGGATQILFGVKGKRWVENESFDNIINEYFVYPDEVDRVENSSKVENGCYW